MPILATAVIPITQSASNSFKVRYNNEISKLVFVMPTVWTAADLKLQFSLDDGVTWNDIYDNAGDLLKITGLKTTGGGAFFAPTDGTADDTDGDDLWAVVMNNLAPADFRIVSIDTADESAENQAAARTIIITKNYKRNRY